MQLGSLAFILVYLGLMALIGWLVERRRTTAASASEFFIASGQIGFWHSFLTALATGFSAFTFLGAVGVVYASGLDGIVIVAGALIFATPGVVLVGKRLWVLGKKYGYITPADFLADRFQSDLVRVLVAGICFVFLFFYVQIQLVGTGYIMDILTGDLLSYSQAILIMAGVMIFYVTLGGMRAVVWTDAVQAVLLSVGLGLVAVFVVSTGVLPPQEAVNTESNIYGVTQSTLYLWTLSVGYGLSICVWPQYYLRYFSARDRRGAFSIGPANDVGLILLGTIFAAMIGYGGLVLVPDVAPDTVTVEIIQLLPVALALPMAAAGVAAAQSSADSLALTASAIGAKDIYVRYARGATENSRDTRIVSRALTGVLIILAVVAALQPPELIVTYLLDLAVPGFGLLLPPTVAGLYWRRATPTGAVAGLASGAVVLVLTTFVWQNPFNVHASVWSLIIDSLLLIVVSFATRGVSEERIERIHGFLDSVDYDQAEHDSYTQVLRSRSTSGEPEEGSA